MIRGSIVGYCTKHVEAELTSANYGEKFQALLHVEEFQMEVDIRQYDIEDAKLIPSSSLEYLILKVLVHDKFEYKGRLNTTLGAWIGGA